MKNILTLIFVCTLFANAAYSSNSTGETTTECEYMRESTNRDNPKKPNNETSSESLREASDQ